MIKFEIHSRQSIPNVVIKDAPYAVISICCYEEEFANLNIHEMNPHCMDILKIRFDDIVYKDESTLKKEGKKYKLFTTSDAEEILSFFYSIKDRIGTILINCDAGISRSSAVTASLLKIYKDDDSEIYNSPKYRPNSLIYRTLLDTYNKSFLK